MDNYCWKDNTVGLYVVVHGLMGTPKFSALSIANYIHEHYPNEYEILVPIVPHKGNCSLDEAVKPILNMVIEYIKRNPGKPIHLIGSSNGGRIVAKIELELRRSNPETLIKVTGVGGVYYGSNAMAYLKSMGLASRILHPDVITSLTTGSDQAISLIDDMQISNGFNAFNRYYEFYGTANDWYIPNIDSCFPNLDSTHNVVYHPLITGVDHVLLGHFIADKIIEDSVIWMKNDRNSVYHRAGSTSSSTSGSASAATIIIDKIEERFNTELPEYIANHHSGQYGLLTTDISVGPTFFDSENAALDAAVALNTICFVGPINIEP